MKVFNLNGFNYCSKPKTFIETPLGHIDFNLIINGTKLSSHSTTFTNDKGDYLTCWYSSKFYVELLICNPILSLPEHLGVDGCQAAIWRIILHDKAVPIDFCANWCHGYIWTSGGANGGDHLEAQTWENEEYEVSLGTQDGEMLQARMKNNELMPVKFNSLIDPFAMVKYISNGLMVPVEQVLPNKICQIHFVVAWAHKKQDDVSTWFAVDLSHKNILNGY